MFYVRKDWNLNCKYEILLCFHSVSQGKLELNGHAVQWRSMTYCTRLRKKKFNMQDLGPAPNNFVQDRNLQNSKI